MCGRFVLSATKETLSAMYNCIIQSSYHPSYNIAPSQSILTIELFDDRTQASQMHWGFLPYWYKSDMKPQINARAETVASKPFFKKAYESRRCVIPASGWYEWKQEAGVKLPSYFSSEKQEILSIAGLWEHYFNEAGNKVSSVAIITRPANPLVANVHSRMPLLIANNDLQAWLGGEVSDWQALDESCNDELVHHLVSRKVGSPKFNDSSCITPLMS